jgi:NAD(P)-dependent dehydrogenase (short-subunit alcohol dehydrogenase family)
MGANEAETARDGRVAVIVGVSDVVGRACAVGAVERASVVVVVDGSRAAADAVAADVEQAGARALPFAADLTDLAAMEYVAATVASDHSAVHSLVSCHCRIEWSSVRASSMESWEDVVRTNVLGPVVATKAFLPLLERAEAATIVHLGSIDGFQGNPRVPSYSASKGALPPLTHVLADELAPAGIRVNCVARAAVDDPTIVAAAPGLQERAMACTPLGRTAAPVEVARVVAFLSGPESSYMTGATVVVDGGRSGLTPGTAMR